MGIRNVGRPALMVADASLRHARAVVPAGRAREPVCNRVVTERQAARVRERQRPRQRRPVGGRALYVVGPDGVNLRRVTPWALARGRPDWSPDGTRILFRTGSNREGGFGANLYTVRPDGTGLRQVTHIARSHRVLPGSYSPDGTSIVFATTDGATDPALGLPDIVVARADGTGQRPVTRSGSWDASPDWGPRR